MPGIPLLSRYVHWLHMRWPAGKVEKLPDVREDSSTKVPGLYVVGDLTGIPLLKLSADSGTRAVRTIDSKLERGKDADVDLAIIGGGVSGYAAAIEAKKLGLKFELYEASEPFSTIINFPKGKPIYTYPSDMTPAGDLQFHEKSKVKEGLLEDLQEQVAAAEITPTIARAEQVGRREGVLAVDLVDRDGAKSTVKARAVIVAIGRSGNHRKLGAPGEDLPKVYNRLHDPAEFSGKRVLVVGGGDSACETALALEEAGASVAMAYRGEDLTRPKAENREAILARAQEKRIDLHLTSQVKEITDAQVTLKTKAGEETTLGNDLVFSMIGREAPLDFFRRSKVPIIGETRPLGWALIALFFVSMIFLYDWKNFGPVTGSIEAISGSEFPDATPDKISGLSEWWAEKVADRTTVIGTLATSMKSRSFYYTLLYSATIVLFGILRIQRRRTPYVTRQTTLLMLVQVIPLFLLPELILPWLGYNGYFDAGTGRAIADQLFELYISTEAWDAKEWPDWGHPRAYWRAYGFILAWPLMVYNVFTAGPIIGWLIIGFVQTFVLIPLMIRRWGKGVYCGWICSCGALAETLGDTQRTKMPHGPGWNRLNFVGQFFLLVAFLLLGFRIWGWLSPESWAGQNFDLLLEGKNADQETVNYISWKWVVDILWGGVLGVGLYFKYSGRVWCRFACPLAALMHIYARFSKFAIVSEKKKCISCNVCTSVCHQGIDVMAFANRGIPMQDPECVRCSACVGSCPTGVLTFGRVDGEGMTVALDKVPASPVQMGETRR